jgi:SAM-dependent methyltransferase
MMVKAQVSGLRLFLFLCTALALPAADVVFTPYAAIRPILQAQTNGFPAGLRNAGEAQWLAWARQEDKAIRARLAQGDLDTLVNFLLYGVSFTKQPRILMEHLTEASKAGVLRARVDDLVSGLRNPGDNERLLFLQQLLRSQGIDPVAGDPAQTGRFLLDNLLRVVKERTSLAQRSGEARGPAHPGDPASLLDRSSLFQDRGLSLDTSIVPAFSIEQTLRDLKAHGLLREGQVTRVAVIGPGLDFIDKNEDSAFDYYPPQTLQPFALYDSLLRLGLAKAGSLSLSIFDISPRVIEHLRRARERAAKNPGYVLQLPRNISVSWPPDLVAYWHSLGEWIGGAVAPIPPPAIFHDLKTRAVRVRPDVVLACQPVDLDIVLERLTPPPGDGFDLIVGTNIFVYYNAFRQGLALANAGAMLKPGGFLLSNDRLPDSDGSSMHLAGVTVVPFEAPGVSVRQAVGWYQK